MRRPPTLLRYPGSKWSLASYIALILEENLLTGCHFYEPYAGSAAVGLSLLWAGYVNSLTLVERDPLVYALWHSVFHDSEALCDMVMHMDISMDEWRRLQPLRSLDSPDPRQLVEMGAAGLFYNRTNYSGIIGAGPIGGIGQASAYHIGCRFNREVLATNIRALSGLGSRISVAFGDALDFLGRQDETLTGEHSFVYLDPPYLRQGRKLYRYHHSEDDHQHLATHMLATSYPWLVSYDDHPRIRAWYSGSQQQAVHMDYSARVSKRGRELLISNLHIPPFSQATGEGDLTLAASGDPD